MNAVVTTTIISVLGAGLFGLMIQYMRLSNSRFNSLESRFDSLESRFDSLETRFATLEARFSRLETKLDSLISVVHAMDTKFTNEIKDLEIRLTEKFTAHLTDLRKEVYDGFKAHGERLARIEVELNIQPPPLEVA